MSKISLKFVSSYKLLLFKILLLLVRKVMSPVLKIQHWASSILEFKSFIIGNIISGDPILISTFI